MQRAACTSMPGEGPLVAALMPMSLHVRQLCQTWGLGFACSRQLNVALVPGRRL